MPRYEYVLALSGRPPGPEPAVAVEVRRPTPQDREALAALMLDAYLGTIDYDGETIDEARAEVAGYLDGSPLLEHSFVGMVEGGIVSACLVGTWEHGPLIGYVMTAAEYKSRGLASHLLDHSLTALAEDGEAEVSAWITEGNLPSERIFRRAGFERRQARADG